MTRAGLFTVATILSAGILGACASFRPHASPTGSRGGLLAPRTPDNAPAVGDIGRGLPGRAPATDAARAERGVRRVCRNGSRPSGWIAIAYVKGGDGDCSMRARNDSSVTVAVLVYYADRPLDAVLDVCADERAPRGWMIDDTDADQSDACPGVERKGSSTYRIRRVR